MSNGRASENFSTHSAVELKNTNPAAIAQGAAGRRRFLWV
jgi:hypothetical protein